MISNRSEVEMSRFRKAALVFVTALTMTALFEASAFADSRHSNRTRGRSFSGRQPFYASGQIARYGRHGGGYRVWVGGTRHPFFIPSSYWHRNRFRVGVFVGLGGYYNPRGYYDYYCHDCYDGYSSDRYYRGR